MAIGVTSGLTPLHFCVGAGRIVSKSKLGLLAFTRSGACAVFLGAWAASVASSAATATTASFAALTHLAVGGVGALFTGHGRCGHRFGSLIGVCSVIAFAVVLAFGTTTIAVAAFIALRAWAAFGALLLAISVVCGRVQVAVPDGYRRLLPGSGWPLGGCPFHRSQDDRQPGNARAGHCQVGVRHCVRCYDHHDHRGHCGHLHAGHDRLGVHPGVRRDGCRYGWRPGCVRLVLRWIFQWGLG